MAEVYGKLTNRPGVCFVTRGPGATNAAHGVHIAQHDGTPMILFVGQVERAMLGRAAPSRNWITKRASPASPSGRSKSAIRRAFRKSWRGRFASPCKAGRGRWSSACPRTS
ncbi:MAG: thiamine pyrophosphate-binding protein [Asticcacaulis sp.]